MIIFITAQSVVLQHQTSCMWNGHVHANRGRRPVFHVLGLHFLNAMCALHNGNLSL